MDSIVYLLGKDIYEAVQTHITTVVLAYYRPTINYTLKSMTVTKHRHMSS